MAQVNIIKGSIRNVVDEVQFEKLYKPNGWRLDEPTNKRKQIESEEPRVPLEDLQTETDVKNYIKMTKKQPKHFNDGLFFSDGESE